MRVNSTEEPQAIEVKRIRRAGDTYVDLLVRWDITSTQVEDPEGETHTEWNYHEETVSKQLHGERSDAEIQDLVSRYASRLLSEAQRIESGKHEEKRRSHPEIGWARIAGFDVDEEKPLWVHRNIDGEEYSFRCYVTQDLVDNYQAGNLSVGDFVSIVFVDRDKDRVLAQQKIYKTW